MRTYRAISVCLLCCCSAALFFATPAFGFCFQPHPSVACDFFNSDAVFTGKVISVHPAEEGRFPDAYYYRLNVLQLFRGPQQKVIEVYTGNDSRGYFLDLGKEYLIFTRLYEGKFTIGNCDDSAPLSEAEATIRQVQKLAIPKDAIVEGQVALHQIPSEQGFAGAQILIRGEGKTYTVTADDKGWFLLYVLPGAYSAEVKLPLGHSVVDYDLSYDGPSRFTVRAGHCAGLQFIADSKYSY